MAAMHMGYGHNADDSSLDWYDVAFQQDISTPFNILIEFEATEYSYSIRIQNFEDIRFVLREISDLSHPYRGLVDLVLYSQHVLVLD